MPSPRQRAASAVSDATMSVAAGEVSADPLAEAQRRLLTLSPDLLSIIDLNGQFQWLNPAWEALLGLPLAALIGRNCFEFIHPDDYGATVAEARRLADGGPKLTFTNRFRCADGSYRWIAWHAAAADGLVYGVARDITDQRQIEAALQESERRYRTVIAALEEGVIVQDADGRVIAANPSAERILGLAPGYLDHPLAGEAPWTALREDGSLLPLELLPARSALRSGEPQPTMVLGIARPERPVTWVAASAQPLIREGETAPYGVVCSFFDLTERKRAEAALRASEARFRSAYEYAAIGMSMIALDGRWLSVNHAICETVGYTAEELLTTTFQAITHPDDLEGALDNVRRLLAGEITHYHMEKRYFHKSGRIVWVMLSVSLTRDEAGVPLYFVSQVQDITARRLAEEELRRSEERARTLWAEADRQARELALLDRVRTALARELDPAATYRTVVEAIAETFGYAHVGLYLRVGDELRLQYQVGYDDALERIPVSRGICGRVARTGEPVLLEDIRDDPDFVGTPEETNSEVCVPLIVEDEIVGILNVESTYTERLGPADLRLVQALAGQVGIAIGRARLYAARDESERDYRLLLEQAADGIFISDPSGRFLTVNARACSLSGYSRDELLARGVVDLIPVDEIAATVRQWGDLQADSSRVVVAERRLLRKDGTSAPVEVSARLLPDGRLQEIARDITERKRAEEELRRRAFHDPLTGLPNRDLFADRLRQALARARRHADHSFAVLCLDLDRFKQINDSLGHPAGDALLVETARRLQGCVREGDTVARLGGDEFAILLEDLQSGYAVEVAERIQRAVASPVLLGEHEVGVSTSIGIALGAARYSEPAELLRDADIALYRSKEQGRARHIVFDEGMHAQAVALLQLENDLRRAVERQQFVLYYQPVVALATGVPIGFEALVRWQHPRHGLVAPAEFISLAEETGLIVPLGRWVLSEACRQLAAWRPLLPGGLDLTVGVNLSSRQFALPDLADQVAAALTESGLPARCLRLELTESTLMEQPVAASATLAQLRALGVQVQVDDFGIGYSSLSYLQRFPLDALKIDRSFIGSLGEASEATAIVRAVVSLAQALGLQVVAEGVETADQRADLRALNCAYGQGYHFAPALHPDQALAFAINALTALTPALAVAD